MEELNNPKVYDHSENDLGQLHKTISELTKELKEVKDILRSSEITGKSTKRIALASLDVAANATLKPNSAQKRVLSEHEIYTPETKKVKQEEKAAENKKTLSTFDAMDCGGLFE